MLQNYRNKSRNDMWVCDSGTDAEVGLLGDLALLAIKITYVAGELLFFGVSAPIISRHTVNPQQD
jgi:hypothetical protein